MRWRDDDETLDGGVAGALLAIDAALDGEPADPEYGELAELALILRSERPAPDPEFAHALDERVARRFARPGGAPPSGSAGRWRRRLAPAAWGAGAVAVAGAAAVVVVLAAGQGGGSPAGSALTSAASSAAAEAAPSGATAAASTAASAPSSAAASPAHGAPRSLSSRKVAAGGPASTAPGSGAAASAAGGAASSGASGSSGAPANGTAGSSAAVPAPASQSGRQVVQSSQLQLSARRGRIEDVAQQVFGVVAAVNGIVDRSSITSGSGAVAGPVVVPPVPGGGAFFQLSVPSSNLSQALSQLSRLRYATVVSRTDATQDITAQVGHAGMQLAEARALRRSLLRQLAAATTQQQIDSLKLQLRDADASIASRRSRLKGLKRQVAYSRVAVTIDAVTPAPKPARNGGFTLGRAAHDAGRVLVVVAGVALIVLAALVPVALLAALGIWIGLAVRRRRRDQALDAA